MSTENSPEPAAVPTPAKPRPKPVPPRRKQGDSPPFHPIAKRLAAETARRSMTICINK